MIWIWLKHGSILLGHSSKGPEKDYSVMGKADDRIFGIFNAIAIIATSYGNGIIPEIQVWNIRVQFLSEIWTNKCSTQEQYYYEFFNLAIRFFFLGGYIIGNDCTTGEGKDVQRTVCMLCSSGCEFLQCCHLWLLGIW